MKVEESVRKCQKVQEKVTNSKKSEKSNTKVSFSGKYFLFIAISINHKHDIE